MHNLREYTFIALTMLAAVFVYNGNLRTKSPSDFRDAPAAMESLEDQDPAGVSENVRIPETSGIHKENAADNDPSMGVPAKPVEWVVIAGGKFMMGTDSRSRDFKDAKPAHEVSVKTFEMSRTAVTVDQYAECVSKGACAKPDTGYNCNWNNPGRWFHPVNCVDWNQANQYARFKGGRLPSEAEWEYAARSGGKNQKYPWGDDKPSCDRAVMRKFTFLSDRGDGCGKQRTWPVCSKPAGNTAQGLCDMAGNVSQWVQDKYKDSYEGAPVDGSAFEGTGKERCLRGGSFLLDGDNSLRVENRGRDLPGYRLYHVGFRIVK